MVQDTSAKVGNFAASRKRRRFRGRKPFRAIRRERNVVNTLLKADPRELRKVAHKLDKMGAEKKYFIKNLGTTTVVNTGVITKLTAVPQGDTDSTRDGDQLTARSIQINYSGYLQSTSTSANEYFRFIVFQWFENDNEYTPVPSDVLLLGAAPGVNQYYLCPYNHDKRFQFRILYDKTTKLVTSSYGGTADAFTNESVSPMEQVMINKIPKPKVQYIGGLTNGVNNIYNLAISSAGVVSMVMISKFNYSDN